MGAFLYGISLQFKMDIRSRSLLVTCYLVPLLFFAVMGGIFTSIMPGSEKTLIQSMTVMGVSMGALIGVPPSLAEIYGTDVRKMYQANGAPLWYGLITLTVSAFIHLLIMSGIILRSHYADCVSLHPPFDHERDYPGCGAGHVSRRGSIRTAALLCEIVTVYHCFSWNCRRAGNAGKEPGKADDAVSGRVSAVDPAVRDHVSVKPAAGDTGKARKNVSCGMGISAAYGKRDRHGRSLPAGYYFRSGSPGMRDSDEKNRRQFFTMTEFL